MNDAGSMCVHMFSSINQSSDIMQQAFVPPTHAGN